MGTKSHAALIGGYRAVVATTFLCGMSSGLFAQSAAGYDVRLLQPGSAAFDELLKNTPSKMPIPQIARSSQLQGSVLINDSVHPVVAYAVRWRVIHQDGSTTVSYQSLSSEPKRGGEVLTGLRAVLKPGAQMFVTPGVHRTPDLGTLASLARVPSGAAPGETVLADLDCAVFADGTIVGPNKSRLFERISVERRAQIDETTFIAGFLDEGRSDEVVRRTLEGHIQQGRNGIGETARDWYIAARSRQAMRMAVLLQNDGRDALKALTSKLKIVRERIDSQASKL
jgi:hypothetical protein